MKELEETEKHLDNAKNELRLAGAELRKLVIYNRHLSGKKNKWYRNLCEFAGYIDTAIEKLNIKNLKNGR